MADYREILRLSADPKNSHRSIQLIVHSDHRKISVAQAAAKETGTSWPLDETVTNEMLQEVEFPNTGNSVTLYVMPDVTYIHRELARSGVNLTRLWTEYCTR